MQDIALESCTNSSAIFQETCWDKLDMSDYLGNATGWVWTVPNCDTSTMAGLSGIGTQIHDSRFPDVR